MSLHSIAAGKITCPHKSIIAGSGRTKSYKTIFDFHTPFVSLSRRCDIEALDDGSDCDAEHDLRQILASTNSGTSPEWHHMLIHVDEFSLRTLKPTLWEKSVGRRKYGRVTMHRPGLSRDDGPRRKCVTHEVEDFITSAALSRRVWYNTFEKTGSSSVNPESWSKLLVLSLPAAKL